MFCNSQVLDAALCDLALVLVYPWMLFETPEYRVDLLLLLSLTCLCLWKTVVWMECYDLTKENALVCFRALVCGKWTRNQRPEKNQEEWVKKFVSSGSIGGVQPYCFLACCACSRKRLLGFSLLRSKIGSLQLSKILAVMLMIVTHLLYRMDQTAWKARHIYSYKSIANKTPLRGLTKLILS